MKGCAHLVDKWLTFPDMGHIVANYYKRCVVVLTNLEIGKSKYFFPLRGSPPLGKQKTPIMCLGVIPNHFVLFFYGWLSTTSIIYGVAQSQEWRCGDMGRWVFGSTWVVSKARDYWKWKQTAATTKWVKQSGAYFVGHSRKTKATIWSYWGRWGRFYFTWSSPITWSLMSDFFVGVSPFFW